uniref:Uncharacterized protein n=1 Tax=Magallana gigas TaxID=29159 RepID=K1PUJ5_MAGGI
MTKFKFKFLKLADEINNAVASVSKDLVPLKEIKFREHQDPIQDKLIIAPDAKHVYEKTMQGLAEQAQGEKPSLSKSLKVA